ncbi:hypothetical protein U1Q18_014445 [Sarracenia purpurea var. burkii]
MVIRWWLQGGQNEDQTVHCTSGGTVAHCSGASFGAGFRGFRHRFSMLFFHWIRGVSMLLQRCFHGGPTAARRRLKVGSKSARRMDQRVRPVWGYFSGPSTSIFDAVSLDSRGFDAPSIVFSWWFDVSGKVVKRKHKIRRQGSQMEAQNQVAKLLVQGR